MSHDQGIYLDALLASSASSSGMNSIDNTIVKIHKPHLYFLLLLWAHIPYVQNYYIGMIIKIYAMLYYNPSIQIFSYSNRDPLASYCASETSTKIIPCETYLLRLCTALECTLVLLLCHNQPEGLLDTPHRCVDIYVELFSKNRFGTPAAKLRVFSSVSSILCSDIGDIDPSFSICP